MALDFRVISGPDPNLKQTDPDQDPTKMSGSEAIIISSIETVFLT